VCLSVYLSQAGTVPKELNAGSRKQRYTLAQGLQFSVAEGLGEIPMGSPPKGAPNRGGVGYNRRFSPNISLYLRNGAGFEHSHYGTLIGTRMRSIEWCYFSDFE